MLDPNFQKARRFALTNINNLFCSFHDWCGQPMLYDSGLFVNRSTEDHAKSFEEYVKLISQHKKQS